MSSNQSLSGLSSSQLEKIRGKRPTGGKSNRNETSEGADKQPEGLGSSGELSDFDVLNPPEDDNNGKTKEPTMPSNAPPKEPTEPIFFRLKVQLYGDEKTAEPLVTVTCPWNSTDSSTKNLGDLRKFLNNHVRVPSYTFCMEDKATVPEDTTFLDYVEDTTPPGLQDAPPSKVKNVYLQDKPKVKPVAVDALNNAFMIKFVSKTEDVATGGSIQSSELGGDATGLTMAHLRPHVTMSKDSSRDEFCLSDGTAVSDSMLLRTYISKGEVPADIESDLPIVTVYFQKSGKKKSLFNEPSSDMKARGNVDTTVDLTLDSGVAKPVTKGTLRPTTPNHSQFEIGADLLAGLGAVTAGKYLTPGELDELQWDVILNNCNVFYGWKFDINSMSVKRAPCKAFKLRKDLNLQYEPELPVPLAAGKQKEISAPATDTTAPDETGEEDAEEEAEEEAPQSKAPAPASKDDVKPKKPKAKPNAIPNFLVVDESKVQISLVSSSLEESMLKNNFSQTSLEVGGSANIKGVDIGGSYGNTDRTESGEGSSNINIEKLLIGNYQFPRTSVSLRAADLEPTEELKSAVERVRLTKSLDALHALHDAFGHFFCEEVLLGGRLQTTRSTKITDKVTETMAKSQFKSQVGLAASVPNVGGLNFKRSSETGSSDEHHVQQINASDTITFEATGGNTILAVNPPKWCESVLDHRNWRVIERAGLTPIAKVISECHDKDMQGVQQWFKQAVPAVSKFFSIPNSRIIHTRLKLESKVPNMNSVNLGSTYERNICHYLGHQFGKHVRPIRIGLEFTSTAREEIVQMKEAKKEQSLVEKIALSTPVGMAFAAGAKLIGEGMVACDLSKMFRETETQSTEEIALFTPARVQAPVILQYEDANLKAGVTEKCHDETVWHMVVPDGKWLKHDSLVMLTSKNPERYQNNVWLTVYRNGEGHFMPAMTSSGEASFWRVTKSTSTEGQVGSKEPEISEGNLITLSWRFSDQVSGFRDFFDDTFGRRTFNKPEGISNELFLKLPFPSFGRHKGAKGDESVGLPMIMSQSSYPQAFSQSLAINNLAGEEMKAATYNLHPMVFRIDLVASGGAGELKDYMTYGLNQAVTETFKEISEKTKKEINPVTEVIKKVDQIGEALLGPGFPIMTAPAKGIISKAMGFFNSIL